MANHNEKNFPPEDREKDERVIDALTQGDLADLMAAGGNEITGKSDWDAQNELDKRERAKRKQDEERATAYPPQKFEPIQLSSEERRSITQEDRDRLTALFGEIGNRTLLYDRDPESYVLRRRLREEGSTATEFIFERIEQETEKQEGSVRGPEIMRAVDLLYLCANTENASLVGELLASDAIAQGEERLKKGRLLLLLARIGTPHAISWLEMFSKKTLDTPYESGFQESMILPGGEEVEDIAIEADTMRREDIFQVAQTILAIGDRYPELNDRRIAGEALLFINRLLKDRGINPLSKEEFKEFRSRFPAEKMKESFEALFREGEVPE